MGGNRGDENANDNSKGGDDELSSSSLSLKRSRSIQASLFLDNNDESDSLLSSSKHSASLPSLQTTTTRSNLFGAGGGGAGGESSEQASTTTSSSILAPATRFPSSLSDEYTTSASMNKNNNKNTSFGGTSSLFGAVMKNAKSNNNSNNNKNPSTPARKTKKVIHHSPGGFQLQDFIGGFSPFAAAATTPSSNKTPSSSYTATPRKDVEWHECSIFLANNDDAPSSSSSSSSFSDLGLLDWSLKSLLEFQCQPAMSIATRTTAQQQHQGEVMRRFMNTTTTTSAGVSNSSSVSNSSTSRSAAVDWQAALLYWQHPATHPLPSHLFSRGQRPTTTASAFTKQQQDDKTTTISKGDAAASSSNNNNNNNNNSRFVSSSAAPPPRKKAAFTITGQDQSSSTLSSSSDSTAALLKTRAMEWQDAFQSLYNLWMERIRQINSLLLLQEQHAASHNIDAMMKEITENYFYACGKGHTLLFRVGLQRQKDNDDDGDDQDNESQIIRLVPEIVISSSTLSLREKLRSMGAKLVLVERWNGLKRGEFHEEAMMARSATSKAKKKKNKKDNVEDDGDDEIASPNVKAELVALRRAQAFGETVGADVSVSIKPSDGNNNTTATLWSPKRMPPLCLSGVDDCAAFFEVYYNTYGQIGGGGGDKIVGAPKPEELLPHDVPLLLCRKLGPFLHSSVQSLRMTKKRKLVTAEATSTARPDYADDEYASILVHGILLPCAVRDLICASVSCMIANEQEEEASRSNNNNSKTVAAATDESDDNHEDDEDDVGTHHLVVRATPYKGEEATVVVGSGTVGSHNSKGFNVGTAAQLAELTDAQGGGDDDHELAISQSCHYGEMLMLAVWDINRPTSLAYKLEHMSTNLLG